MSSSMRNANHKNDPLLSRKIGSKNPIGEEYNVTTNPLNNEEDDFSRIDISGGKKRLTGEGLAIEDIAFLE